MYLTESKGREIYDTIYFVARPTKRTFNQVIEAFDGHRNLMRNKPVGQYKFFSTVQATNEPLQNFVAELKFLTVTYNFRNLKYSLVRNRIICGIKHKQLREALLKEPSVDWERCLNAYRTAGLQKDRRKTLEDEEEINSIKQKKRRRKPQNKTKTSDWTKRDIQTTNIKKTNECKC